MCAARNARLKRNVVFLMRSGLKNIFLRILGRRQFVYCAVNLRPFCRSTTQQDIIKPACKFWTKFHHWRKKIKMLRAGEQAEETTECIHQTVSHARCFNRSQFYCFIQACKKEQVVF